MTFERRSISPEFERLMDSKSIRELKHAAIPMPQFAPNEKMFEVYKVWVKKNSKGIFFHSIPGCGKTTSLLWFYHELVENNIDVRFISAFDLVDSCKSAIGEGKNHYHKIVPLQECGVLILDDLGAEKITEFSFKDVIYPLINERVDFSKPKPTIIASNLTMSDVARKYGECDAHHAARFISRLEYHFISCEINTASHRVPLRGI